MNRLNGYGSHFRGRFLLLHRKLLSDSEFILWDLSFSALADWDKKNHNPENYGSFDFQQTEIGYLLGWHKTKVSHKAQRLFALGLWTKKEGRVFVKGFDVRDNFAEITRSKKIVDLQEQVAILQSEVAKTQRSVVIPQRHISKENEDISSYGVAILQQPHAKVPLVSFKNEFNVLRSDDEYQKIWEENPNGLSIEDMKWIDQNIRENAQI